MRLSVGRAIVAAALALAAGACKDSLEVSAQNWGFVEIIPTPGATAGQYVTQPTGTFFRSLQATGVLNTAVAPDSCIGGLDFAATTPPTTALPFIDAGAVSVAFPGKSVALAPLANNTLVNYLAPTSTSYTPGDSATVTISGVAGGYAAFTQKVKTAEPFTLGSVSVPPAGAVLSLSWTPAVSGGSIMIISLRYAGGTSSTLDKQLFCVLADDGTHDIPATQLGAWRVANNGLREVAATRFRATQVRNGSALLQIRSRFEATAAVTP